MLERIEKYLTGISEMKHTVPDFSSSPLLNNLFGRTFGPYIEYYKGLIHQDTDLDERLRRAIPSHSYQGLFLHDIEIAGNIDSVILFIVIKEFLMLTTKNSEL